MLSIRAKLVFFLVTALVLAGVVASVATYYSTRMEFAALFDAQLKHSALELAESGRLDVNSVALVGQAPEQQITLQIYDASVNRLYIDRHSNVPLTIAETPGFSEFTDDTGHVWRQFAAAVGTRIVQAAQPLEVRQRLAASAALRILQPVLILIAFLAIAVWFVVVQVLHPLSKTARAVAQRSPSTLTPLETKGLPYEVKSLADAVNRLMQRLGDSLSAQQRFASDAAHELRTPLAGIKLQAQLLARAKTDEDRAKYAGRLQQGVSRATRLVEQLLTIARLDPDASKKPMAEARLTDIVKSVAEDLAPIAETKSITLTANAPTDVTAMGLPDALRLMIANLTDNAIRYTPEGGRIEIGLSEKRGDALITVTDNGPGIAPEERERVFERFYRALGTKVQGTGLGLAIVQRIVAIHGAEIRIEDGFRHENDDGCGARFVIRLPLTRTTLH